MDIENIRHDMEVAARINHRTRRVHFLRNLVYNAQYVVILLEPSRSHVSLKGHQPMRAG